MALKTFVKVGCITNLSDARFCAGMGVDMLGFRVVEGQENYIEPAQFQEIRGWISGPSVVAEVYGIRNSADLNLILDNYKPDYIEMGITELLLFTSIPLPLVLSVSEKDVVAGFSIQPTYLITKKGFKSSVPLIVEVDSRNAAENILLHPNTNGIALKGGRELKPGLKDFEVLHEVLELLEVED